MSTLADKLELAAVKYDARILKRHQRNARVYHNPHALGLYRARIKDVLADVARGASPREAIVTGFEGTLRQAMLRACGFPADWSESGALTYQPVTKEQGPRLIAVSDLVCSHCHETLDPDDIKESSWQQWQCPCCGSWEDKALEA